MSMNVIIIAIIALIVLVVLIITFTSRYRIFGKTTASCQTKGGNCFASCNTATQLADYNTDCKELFADKERKDPNIRGTVCCIPFGP